MQCGAIKPTRASKYYDFVLRQRSPVRNGHSELLSLAAIFTGRQPRI
jgi:hypothetical protein